MSLRFLIDQCVPAAVSRALERQGHEVIRVRDVLNPRSPDDIVIAKAQELSAILISLNGDFSDLVSYPPSKYGGIIAIQLHNHPELLDRLMKHLLTYLDGHPDPMEYRGKLLIVEVHRIRIRQ